MASRWSGRRTRRGARARGAAPRPGSSEAATTWTPARSADARRRGADPTDHRRGSHHDAQRRPAAERQEERGERPASTTSGPAPASIEARPARPCERVPATAPTMPRPPRAGGRGPVRSTGADGAVGPRGHRSGSVLSGRVRSCDGGAPITRPSGRRRRGSDRRCGGTGTHRAGPGRRWRAARARPRATGNSITVGRLVASATASQSCRPRADPEHHADERCPRARGRRPGRTRLGGAGGSHSPSTRSTARSCRRRRTVTAEAYTTAMTAMPARTRQQAPWEVRHRLEPVDLARAARGGRGTRSRRGRARWRPPRRPRARRVRPGGGSSYVIVGARPAEPDGVGGLAAHGEADPARAAVVVDGEHGHADDLHRAGGPPDVTATVSPIEHRARRGSAARRPPRRGRPARAPQR